MTKVTQKGSHYTPKSIRDLAGGSNDKNIGQSAKLGVRMNVSAPNRESGNPQNKPDNDVPGSFGYEGSTIGDSKLAKGVGK